MTLTFEIKIQHWNWILRTKLRLNEVLHLTLAEAVRVSKTSISIRGHLAFMQIKKVAQGCRLGNQAEFVPRPHTNTNRQKQIHCREHFRVR